MTIYDDLTEGSAKLAVIGMGYVGMPIAVAFSEKVDVIGFDCNSDKIDAYRAGVDPTKEVGDAAISNCASTFTTDESELENAGFFIVAVPTPVNKDHTPDLSPLRSASKTVGKHLSRGDIVVYESTVYPGVTEEICVPILEEESGLVCGEDFKVGYSPERINPGDCEHRLATICKIVSGMDEESLEVIAQVYSLIIDAGVYKAESIKVAEAAKVIENSQRDINIAFMNELAVIFHKLGIDTRQVLKAAGTKWNFLKFSPGLVGGHCIGVDPYYLTHKAEEVGYHSQIILAGRRINDGMGKYIAENLVKRLIAQSVPVKGACVAILGFTFKEDCPDTRNTKVVDIVNELMEYGVNVLICDPVADASELSEHYGITATPFEMLQDIDAFIVAVGHDEFKAYSAESFLPKYSARPARPILFDVKGIYDESVFSVDAYDYWRL